MERVSIEIPGELYSSIYSIYREHTSEVVQAQLEKLVRNKGNLSTSGKVKISRYVRPGSGTITGRVWEIADKIKADSGTAERGTVIEACIREDININTANTQYSYWKKAHW